MLRIKVEIEPYGMTIDKKTLAEIRIWNTTGGGYTDTHQYEYEIYEPKPLAGKPISKKGSIKKYNRKQPVINLLKKVLEDMSVE